MAQQSPTIKLPRERVDQLKSLGEVWNLSVADVIAKMVNQQVEAGVISGDVPGVTVERQGDRFRLDMLNGWDRTFQKIGSELREDRLLRAQELRQLAKSLRDSFDLPKGEPLLPTPKGFDLSRRGRYLKLRDSITGSERTLPPSVAKDIAKQIRSAVD